MKRHFSISDLAELIYTILLLLYPADFRRRFGPAMVEVFRTQWDHLTSLNGPKAWVTIIANTLADIIKTAPRQRLEAMSKTITRVFSGFGSSKATRGGLFGSILQDLRFGLRTLRQRRLYAAVAVLTLGLGIGASTAMFSVVDGVLLKKLPYQEPGRLVTVWLCFPWKKADGPGGRWDHMNFTDEQYRDWKEHNTLFQDVALYLANEWGEGTLTEMGRPERISVGTSTASLLPVLGVQPALGRWFLPGEEGSSPGQAAKVAVLSDEMWRRRFGGGSEVLGKTLVLDGITFTVVGVLPREFRLRWLTGGPLLEGNLTSKDIWVPFGQLWDCIGCGSNMYQVVGRLSPGATIDQARAETRAILTRQTAYKEMDVRLVPRDEDEVRGLSSPLTLLFGATGLLLLIACGNIATLSLGEMHGRHQEVATRSALGAGGSRIVRQLLTESIVLGLMGSAVGAFIAFVGTRALVLLAPPIPRIDEVGVNLRVLAFATLLGMLTGLAFGTVSSIVSTRSSISDSLRSGGRTGSGRGWRFGRTVVALEIALTVVLLVTAGLLVRSLSRLLEVDPGFETENLATLRLSLPDTSYPNEKERSQFFLEVLGQLETTPGVRAVTAANGLPFPGRTANWGVAVEGNDSEMRPSARLFHVAAGYHEMMGIPLLAGRTFNSADGPDAPSVAVVSESLARLLWPDESPIGARLWYPWETVTVVGIVSDVHRETLDTDPEPTFYVPFVQFSRGEVSFAARTKVAPDQAIPLMREAVWSVDEKIAITEAGTMASLIARSTSEERYRTLLMTVFGVMAAILAAVGIFGVTARAVAHKTREFGIRMALGARDRGLVRMVLRAGLVTVAAGIVLGLLGASWASALLHRFLFDVESSDPLTYGAVALLLVVVCLSASYLPARRITSVNPVNVLRSE